MSKFEKLVLRFILWYLMRDTGLAQPVARKHNLQADIAQALREG